jgi:hypothetical protein
MRNQLFALASLILTVACSESATESETETGKPVDPVNPVVTPTTQRARLSAHDVSICWLRVSVAPTASSCPRSVSLCCLKK